MYFTPFTIHANFSEKKINIGRKKDADRYIIYILKLKREQMT